MQPPPLSRARPGRNGGSIRLVPPDPPSRGGRRRTLSQNFLRDDAARALFASALPDPDGLPGIEVGAGDGALTPTLAAHFGRLTAYERDPEMAARLRRRLSSRTGVSVVVGDFLSTPPPTDPCHLAGNIPFGITSGIVRWCLDAQTLRSATLITQLEYARKRTGDYGRWSQATVLSWPWWSWHLAGRIARSSFRPMPSVDAGVLALRRRPQPLLAATAAVAWERAVLRGFGGVGGSLHASLRALYPRARLDAAFAAAGIGQQDVVAFVHPDQWVTLVAALPAPRRGSH